MTTFNDFALLAPLTRALQSEGYTKPTPIQVQAIPHALSGRDLLGIAQTGTGKTCAFALPILQRLSQSGRARKPGSCRSLILSPTRELASQIADSFRAYGRFMSLSIDVVFGGTPVGRQVRRLAGGVDVLVATPGRLLDLISQRALRLDDIEILVLDEADQMLDLGFIVPLKRIQALLPKKRQTMFFSATMPDAIAKLAGGFLTDPVKVAVTPVATTAERVSQSVIHVAQGIKQSLLHHMLRDKDIARVLVFTRTKHGADRVMKHLGRENIHAAAIHGNKSQAQRERALGSFRAGSLRVLVATDIAARGIDVDGVTHVINFDLPNVPESYVHRIGRTARAGAAGAAISFCSREEMPYLRDIEKLTRQPVPTLPLPQGFVAAPMPREEAPPPVANRPAHRAQPDRRDGPRQEPARNRRRNFRAPNKSAGNGERKAGGQAR